MELTRHNMLHRLAGTPMHILNHIDIHFNHQNYARTGTGLFLHVISSEKRGMLYIPSRKNCLKIIRSKLKIINNQKKCSR